VVLVTHDPDVGDACDRVVRMRDGYVQDHAAARVQSRSRPVSQPKISAAGCGPGKNQFRC
jgi:ABC-type sulfate/molybdate transport systems ATPase subunit